MAEEQERKEEARAATEIGPPSPEAVQQSLADEKAKAERYLANWQRTQADLVNYQKRVEREKSDLMEYARNAVILALLPVADDFEFAVASAPPDLSGNKWADGVKLIQRKLQAFLESQGVMPIEAKGQPFDPRYHEAVMKSEGEENIVVQELRRGYKIKDTVLRPSLVVVGAGQKGEPETETKAETRPETPHREPRKHDRDTTSKRDNQKVEKGG